MRKIAIDILIGILLVVALTIVQLILSLVFGVSDDVYGDVALRAKMVNMLFLASSLPAAALAALAVHLLKPATLVAVATSAGIWMAVQLADYAYIGLTNGTAAYIFGGYGFYVSLLLLGSGPIAYALIRKLPFA